MTTPNSGQALAAIEAHIGACIRNRRKMLGVSREQLAEMICVSSQQMLKYECGANRVSIGRLHAIACALNAPIASFYEGLVGEPKVVPPQQRMILKIVRNFADIQNEKHQEALSQVVRALAGR